jgi:hypothetical protein
MTFCTWAVGCCECPFTFNGATCLAIIGLCQQKGNVFLKQKYILQLRCQEQFKGNDFLLEKRILFLSTHTKLQCKLQDETQVNTDPDNNSQPTYK